MSVNVEEKYVDCNGLRMFYREMGSGPPLILFHGGGITGHLNWSHHYGPLAKHFHIYSPDNRGHGNTNNPQGEFTTYRMHAEDMIAFVDAVGLRDKKPAVMGHSSGALIALHMSAYWPELFSRQVLIAIHPYIGESESFKRGMEQYYGTDDFRNPPRKWAYIIRHPLDAYALWQAHKTTNWYTLLKQAWPMWVKPLSLEDDDYLKVACPSQVIMGSRDDFGNLDEAKDLSDRLADSQFVPLNGQDHLFVVDNPELLRKHALPFLRTGSKQQ